MLILGIDPGTRIIGYGLIQTQPKTKVITYGVIKTASGVRRQASNALDAQYTTRNAQRKTQSASELSTRLLRSYQQILKIIKEYQPDQMAIETVFFSMDAQATIKIGEARGVALLAAAPNRKPVYEYSPA